MIPTGKFQVLKFTGKNNDDLFLCEFKNYKDNNFKYVNTKITTAKNSSFFTGNILKEVDKKSKSIKTYELVEVTNEDEYDSFLCQIKLSNNRGFKYSDLPIYIARCLTCFTGKILKEI